MTPRVWNEEEFRAAYERYRTFYRWMQKLNGNPTNEEMLNSYTSDQRDRDEIRVMYEATRLMNEYGITPAKVKGVDVTEDGRVTLNMGKDDEPNP